MKCKFSKINVDRIFEMDTSANKKKQEMEGLYACSAICKITLPLKFFNVPKTQSWNIYLSALILNFS